MKYWLPLTLAAIAAAFLAGCATAPGKSNEYTVARASGGTDCQRLAQPGDTKIRIYCKQSRSMWPVAGPSNSLQAAGIASCRRLAKATFGPILTFCGSAAQWDDFDAQAVKNGVTCRWIGHPAGEICLDGGQWLRAETNRSRRTAGSQSGFANSSSTGWTSPANSSALDATAGSYGPFPAGGAIGQTFH